MYYCHNTVAIFESGIQPKSLLSANIQSLQKTMYFETCLPTADIQ